MAKQVHPATTEQTPELPGQLRMTFEQAAESMIGETSTMDDIVVDIVNAETIDDILGGTAIGLESIIGQSFTINRAELRKSDFTDGLAAYVVMHVTFDTGETGIVTSGASKIVAQVVSMHQKGFLPYRVSSYKATKATEKGYFPMSLCKAPAYDPADHGQF